MTEATNTKKLPPLYNVKQRGKFKGYIQTPHRNKEGNFVVSLSRYKKDYIFVQNEAELRSWVEAGYSVRMSNINFEGTKAPNLIRPESIQFADS